MYLYNLLDKRGGRAAPAVVRAPAVVQAPAVVRAPAVAADSGKVSQLSRRCFNCTFIYFSTTCLN